jgi:excisionase family DNA binding protein
MHSDTPVPVAPQTPAHEPAQPPLAGRGLTVSEVARTLRVGRRRVRELIRSGQLPAVNVAPDLSGRPRVIVLAEDLRHWVESRRLGPPPRPARRRRRPPEHIDYYP